MLLLTGNIAAVRLQPHQRRGQFCHLSPGGNVTVLGPSTLSNAMLEIEYLGERFAVFATDLGARALPAPHLNGRG